MKLTYSLILASLFSTTAFSADFNKVSCDLRDFGIILVDISSQTVKIDSKKVNIISIKKTGSTVKVKFPTAKSILAIASIEIEVPRNLSVGVFEEGTPVSVVSAYKGYEYNFYGCFFSK